MLPGAIAEIRRLFDSPMALLEFLGKVNGRGLEETEDELENHLALRVLFVLIGEVETAANHRVLEARLTRLLAADSKRIKALAAQLSSVIANRAASSTEPRSGVGDLSHTSRRAIYERQRSRCAVCGWDFSGGGSERSSKEGSPTLDHIVPYRLGGDALCNLQIVCGLCNAAKRERCHVGENGPVWSNNHVYWQRRRAIAFWTLIRDGRCCVSECGAGPSQSRLYVTRKNDRGAWLLDNCITMCDDHVGSFTAIQY